MFKWLEEQGEVHTKAGEVTADYSSLPPDIARVVSVIMRPYMMGSRGRCVLGLLLRCVCGGGGGGGVVHS